MHTNYFDGFTEAMIRNLDPTEYSVGTMSVTYDETRAEIARPLRIGWAGRYRTTFVANDRGVLLLEELHIPLATELSAALRRLSSLEQIIRESLPGALECSEQLASAVVIYADRFDVMPSEPRLRCIEDEERPHTTLEPLFDELFDQEPDAEAADELLEAMRQCWETYSREDWLAHYRDVDAA